MGRRFALALSLLGCALSLSSLPAAAKERIVSIGPATTELILALGGEQSLVATDVSSPEPRGVPKVGYHRALAAEGILSLSPTLVVGSDEMGPPPALELKHFWPPAHSHQALAAPFSIANRNAHAARVWAGRSRAASWPWRTGG